MAIQSLNATTYKAENLGDVKPIITIGGDDASKFIPNINASFFNDEFYFNLNEKNRIVDKESASIVNDKLLQSFSDGITDEYYIDKTGRLKWDKVFSACPKEFIISYKIKCSSGIEFLYQGELTEKEKEHCERPDEVIGSYAVYCSKINNKYKTGKVCHIYRPFVIDANGKKEWCILTIDNGYLYINLPIAFLQTATYPVRLDPTFGYTSVGGSTDTGSITKAAYAYGTPASNGELTNIALYCATESGTATLKTGLYADSAATPAGLLAASSAGDTITTISSWCSSTIAYSVLSGTQYWLAFWANYSGITYYYDSCDNNEYAVASAHDMSDPFNTAGYLTWRVSIYATYTSEAGGTTPKGVLTKPILGCFGGMI